MRNVRNEKKTFRWLGFSAVSVNGRRMASPGASDAAPPSGCGYEGYVGGERAGEYRILLPFFLSGISSLNAVVLHRDVLAKPYQLGDFKGALQSLDLLKDMKQMGSYKVNHVWLVTMKTLEAKGKLLAASELQIKGKQ